MTFDPFDPPAEPEYRPPQHNWGAALVVTCLGLGFALSWATYEMRQRVGDEVNIAVFRHDLDKLGAEQADLGRLLADPRTKLVRLEPSDPSSPVRVCAVAWNQQRQSGIIFCEDLVALGRQRYQVWLIPASGDPTAVAFGPTEPGRAVYAFSAKQPAMEPSQIFLTVFHPSPTQDVPAPQSGLLATGTVP